VAYTLLLGFLLPTTVVDGSAAHLQTGLIERVSVSHPEQVYYLYVPASYDGTHPLRLLVSVHGDQRGARAYAQHFAAFAEKHGYLVLAPLFGWEVDYQRLGLRGLVRADLRLLELVDEVAQEFRIDSDRFDLFGFSGGGQFAHRFLYFHPDRIRSLVVGAPGTVTLPSNDVQWPAGLGGIDQLDQTKLDLAAIQAARTMFVVGSEDTELEGLNRSRIANLSGPNRLERARTLHQAWDSAGIPHQYLEISGLGHLLDDRILFLAQDFLAR
jgi:pimeloyl-ACP methyl ester carboxylesterase